MKSSPFLPLVFRALPMVARFVMAASVGVSLSNCTSKPKAEVIVSVKDQRMGLYENGQLKKQYVISTSKFGVGDQPNSYRTPLGKHEIIAKIGNGLPPGAVLKSRHWNGEVLKPNAPGRDPIVSRILWLRGMERTNRNAMKRYIYIHGTPEESRLGTPASYGCVRMGMKDVVSVFDDIGVGAKVIITKNSLPGGGKKLEEVKEEPAAPPADQLVAEASKTAGKTPEAATTPAAVTPDKKAKSTEKPKTEEKVGPDKVGPEVEKPIAKSKTPKKPAPKNEKVTTSKRSEVASNHTHG